MALRLTEARTIIDGAIAKAAELGAAVSVAVCGQDGLLIALNIMDDALAMANQGSVGKAIAAAKWGLPSGDPTGALDQLSSSLAVGLGFPAIPLRGGLPIIRSGIVEGACGVAGSSSNELDEDCARAGIAALDAKQQKQHK
jgi:glc operon protein GlcG